MNNRAVVLGPLLEAAQDGRFAVGSFNCRYWPMIRAALRVAQELESPVSIQISQREIGWFEINLKDFMAEVRASVEHEHVTVPYAIHLDHSWDFDLIKSAIDIGFTSVMIDASAHPLAENIRITREVVERAHSDGVTVEGELGRIGSADKLESFGDEALYTDPQEAKCFVEETGVDYLAVAIGTAHGVYPVKNPKIDFERLSAIRRLVGIPLVLHGGTGLPQETIHRAVNIEGGGISKVNVATELELALLAAVGRKERMSAADIRALSPQQVEAARAAVEPVVRTWMRDCLASAGRARG